MSGNAPTIQGASDLGFTVEPEEAHRRLAVCTEERTNAPLLLERTREIMVGVLNKRCRTKWPSELWESPSGAAMEESGEN